MIGVPNVLRRHAAGVTLGSVVLLAAVLRFPTLGTQSLWTDEGQTVAWLHGSFTHMLSAVAHNESSPPLYFCLAWLWAKIFGDWIVALRALSAVLGCATVAIAFWGAKRIFGLRVAGVLGLLAATSAMLIWYSQEARQYALLLLLCTLSLALWARVVLLREDRQIVWWALVSGLALATHYFAVFIVVPEAAVLLFRVRRTRQSVVAAGVLAAFCAALAPFAIYQRHTEDLSWSAATGSLFSRIRATEGRLLVNGGAGIPHGWWLGRLFVLAALALILWRGTGGERRAVAGAVALAAAVIVLAVLVAVVGVDYVLPRHLLPAYLPLLAGVAVALGSTRVGRLGLLVAVAGAALGVAVTLSINGDLAYQREDVRDVVRALGAPSPNRVVVVQRPADTQLADGGLPVFQYYAPSLRRLSGRAVSADVIDVIDQSLTAAQERATITRLRLLGFALTGYRTRQVFVTYELRALHPIALTRDALLRAASFGGAEPLLLSR